MTGGSSREPVVVVCGIIERGDTFLAALRGPGQSNAGLWEFPGGKVKPGEMAKDALKRELREELGIEVLIGEELTHQKHSYPWITIELIPFTCTIGEGEPHPHEHEAVRWVTASEAGSLNWSAADIPILTIFIATE